MPKFTITETYPSIQVWKYEVEASTHQEAFEKWIKNENLKEIDYYVSIDDLETPEIEIKEN